MAGEKNAAAADAAAGSKNRKALMALVLTAVLLTAAYAVYRIYSDINYSERADRVLEQMYNIVPGLGIDTGVSTGAGREELAAVSIDGIDIVGCLEIPALDMMVPVTAKGAGMRGFVSFVSGSPVNGGLRLTGGGGDVFRDLEDLRPGETIAFTDMDGVRYRYTVTTQYHLKEWDEGDNDLMLGRKADSDSELIVGCTAS